MESKKICLITPSLQMGGIERAMSTLANYFSDKGHEVYMITIFPREVFFKIDEKIQLFVPSFEFKVIGRSLFETVQYYWKVFSPFNGHVKNNIVNINPDVVMAFGDWLPHLAMLCLRGRYPFYYCNRSNPHIKYSKLQELIRKLAYRYTPPAGIIAQTSQAAERKRKLLKNKCPIRIIPNPAREIECKKDDKKNWIISVGRMHFEKGYVRLMKAFKKVYAPDWKLVLVGSGIHEKEIKQKAIDLGIEDRVTFTGKTNQVDKYLCESKIYVLSSHNEGFPNALCEGMAAGLPCVAFDIVAGPSDIIDNGINGFLIPDGNIEMLTDKLQYLIENQAIRNAIGKEAEKITQRFSLEKIGNMYLEFLLGDH